MHSRTPTTAYAATIWTFKADQLASPSTYKYKYKYKNLTVACHICVQPTVDYIGVPRTVGVVWVCRRFDLSPF